MRQNSLERNKTHLEGIDTQNKETQTNKNPNKTQKQQRKAKQQNTNRQRCQLFKYDAPQAEKESRNDSAMCIPEAGRQCHLQSHQKSKSSSGGGNTHCFSHPCKIHTTELLSISQDIQADSAASLLPPLKQLLKALDRLAFTSTRHVTNINLLQ